MGPLVPLVFCNAGVGAGGLLFAGGMGLREATGEDAFLPISVGLFALGALFVTPIVVAAVGDAPPSETSLMPLSFRF